MTYIDEENLDKIINIYNEKNEKKIIYELFNNSFTKKEKKIKFSIYDLYINKDDKLIVYDDDIYYANILKTKLSNYKYIYQIKIQYQGSNYSGKTFFKNEDVWELRKEVFENFKITKEKIGWEN